MFTISNVSNQLHIRLNEPYAVKPAADYLEQARNHLQEYKQRPREYLKDKKHFLESARVSYGNAIRMAETEWHEDPWNQEKENALIAMYSEYADFLSESSIVIGIEVGEYSDYKDQYKKNLINTIHIYDAAVKMAEAKQQRNPYDEENKKDLIKIYSSYLSALNVIEKDKLLGKNKILGLNDIYEKINAFLIPTLMDKKETKDIRIAAIQAFYKQNILPKEKFLTSLSVLMDKKEDIGCRLMVANSLIRNNHKFHRKLLPDDTLSSLSTILTNTEEKEEIREAAGELLQAQKILPADFIANNMSLLTSVLENKEEDIRLRHIIANMLVYLCEQDIDKVPDNMRLASISILIDRNDEKILRLVLAKALTMIYTQNTYTMSNDMRITLMNNLIPNKFEEPKIVTAILKILNIPSQA